MIRARDSWHRHRAIAEGYLVRAVHRSSSELAIGMRRHADRSGAACVVEPGLLVRHVRLPVPETVDMWLIPISVARGGAAGQPPASPASGRAAAAIYGAFCRLSTALNDSGATALEWQSRLGDCLDALAARRQSVARPWRYAPEAPPPPRLWLVRDMLQDRLCDPPTLDELARESGLNRFALVRSFTRHFGVPPHQYLVHARLSRARLLITGGARLVDAAAETGFADQSHMARHMKRWVGLPPSVFLPAARGERARRRLQLEERRSAGPVVV